jgi:predicted enzyme related to lactoylglutathione lyase
MTRFCRFELRTKNLAEARAFYLQVLGEGGAGSDIVPLPEGAAARGVPAHWLGHLGVDDVEGAARGLVERGASRLGPTRPTADGGQVAILRGVGGAVVAVATPPSAAVRTDVIWHHLNTTDLAGAMASYCEVFGWQLTERLELGAAGVYQWFAWQAGGASMGSMADIGQRPGMHPHWLFHFRVPALEPAMEAVRAAGGSVLDPVVVPSGDRIAVCDDPQGAAFALRESKGGMLWPKD